MTWLWWTAQYIQRAMDQERLFFPLIFDLLESILRTVNCMSLTIKSVLSLEIFKNFFFFCYATQPRFTKQLGFIHSVFENISYKYQQPCTTWNICEFVHLWGKVITSQTLFKNSCSQALITMSLINFRSAAYDNGTHVNLFTTSGSVSMNTVFRADGNRRVGAIM